MTDDKRLNHDAMQRAAERPVKGEGVNATIAASGGLEVPGREPGPPRDVHANAEHEAIPGERERDTAVPLSHAFGEGLESNVDNTMDERTRDEHAREGGAQSRITTHKSRIQTGDRRG